MALAVFEPRQSHNRCERCAGCPLRSNRTNDVKCLRGLFRFVINGFHATTALTRHLVRSTVWLPPLEKPVSMRKWRKSSASPPGAHEAGPGNQHWRNSSLSAFSAARSSMSLRNLMD